jgi:TonB-linked SusC/RagA family outer membrane protein
MYKFYTNRRRHALYCAATKPVDTEIIVDYFRFDLTRKIIMRINITILALITSLLQVTAKSSAQMITISEQNISLQDLFKEIRLQGGYDFLYKDADLKGIKKISIEVKNLDVDRTLQSAFSGLPLKYTIRDKIVMVSRGNVSSANRISTISVVNVKGKVTDEKNQPLIGATIHVRRTGKGVVTNDQGEFSLSNLEENDVLIISYTGFIPQEVVLNGRSSLTIVLKEDQAKLTEVVVVGYGTQTKANLTGAVSTIKGKDILTTKNENVQNMITGKIAGVRITQKTAEPGTFNNSFDIRGMGTPLVVIDGIPRTVADFQRLDPNDIEDLSVLKDASAAIYGVRAANGVVLVTTKKGNRNTTPELNYSNTFTLQVPSGMPATLDAIQFMTLRNEQALHNLNGGSPVWSEADFEAYRNGTKKSTDWYSTVFAKSYPQTQHNISVTGGSEKTTYHIGLGYLYQDGMFKSDDLKYHKYNIRSNITTEVAKGLTFDLNLNAVMDQKDRPYINPWEIIKTFWRTGPHNPAYADPEETMFFYGLIAGDNPLAWIQSDVTGYNKNNQKWMQPTVSLKWDIPGVKGLSAKGLFNYDYFTSETTVFKKAYNQYRFNEVSGAYDSYLLQSPSTIERRTNMQSKLLTQAMVNYDRSLGNHSLSGVLVWETQKRKGDNFSASRELTLPLDHLFAGIPDNQQATMDAGGLYEDANMGLAGKFNYAFSNKYLAEVLFRYDGSSKFAPGHQWGFFPAASVGWRISEEDFFKKSPLSFMQQLKVRASYGVLGDDGASSYQFASGYNYPTGTNPRMFTAGYLFDGKYVASANNKGIPNPLITWYTSKTFDIGMDMDAWNGLFGFKFDYFSRKREGLLATRSGGIPTVVGAGLPQENINSDRTFGLELELSHRNTIGDFTYQTRAIGTITRVKRLFVERAPNGSSWSDWKNNQNGRLQGIHSGLQGAGQFSSWEEIWNSPIYIDQSTIIGDYRYQDWNGDGEINGQDEHPIRFNQAPWVNFSFILDGTYKGFDASLLFQGSAMSSLIYGEKFTGPGGGNDNALAQFYDRWHPLDPKADPYDPATQWVPGYYAYTGTGLNVNSTFNTVNGAYLRLKSVELGYTLPKLKVIRNLRVYVNAYNLFTFTKVRDVDPEHPADDYGYMYPLNRTYSVGLNVKF